MKPKLKRKRPAPGRMSKLTGAGLKLLLCQGDHSQRGIAKILGIGERTMRAYCLGEKPIPVTVDYAVRWAIHEGITESAQLVSHKGSNR